MARSRDEAAHAARQAAILDVAAELFAARGFHATGIAALCAAVEMSPGALYRYFRGKDEIVRALVQREADRTVARVDALKAAAHDRASLIDALVDELVATIGQSDDVGALAMTLEVWAEGARDPDSARVLAAAEAASVAALAEAIDAAAARGWIGPVDPAAVARWLLAAADGAQLWWPAAEAERARGGLRAMVAALLPAPAAGA
jgi:AcrR family transcriptional regulator